MNTPRLCILTSCALLLLAAASSTTCAAEEPWEKLPNGVLGRLAMFEGAGGVKIAGYVRKPAGEGPFPLVIVLHGGGPTAKATTGDTAEERAKKAADEAMRASKVMGRAEHPPLPEFLTQGWAVLQIDYRTNPRYILDPLEWDDTLAAVKMARAFPFVDTKRLAMIGGSHGGHVTARMISRVDLACAVICAPAGLDLIALSHLADKGTAVGGNQGLIRALEQRSKVKMADIEKNPEKYDYTSPLTEIAKVRCPILLISGKNDPNAPLPVMDAYVDKLRAAKKAADTYHPDNGPHGFYWGIPKVIPETAESTRRAVAFIKKHFDKVEQETSTLVPLTELGAKEYQGFKGGLYPDGKNARPADHEALGLALAKQVRPLDAEGKPSPTGKIVLLSLGASGAEPAFARFMQRAAADKAINPSLILVNGAQGGISAFHVGQPSDTAKGTKFWTTVDERLKKAGVTRQQVQAAWLEDMDPLTGGDAINKGFPPYARTLAAEFAKIAQVVSERFPHVKLLYLTSHYYSGFSKGPAIQEPYAYETGFAVKWVIERQLNGDKELNCHPERGAVKAPWLSWGPYTWANGLSKRADDLFYEEKDYVPDGIHLSDEGKEKVAQRLLEFFKQDPTSKGWFVR